MAAVGQRPYHDPSVPPWEWDEESSRRLPAPRTKVWFLPDQIDVVDRPVGGRRGGMLVEVEERLKHMIARRPGVDYRWDQYEQTFAPDGRTLLTRGQSLFAEGKALSDALLADQDSERHALVGHCVGAGIITRAVRELIERALYEKGDVDPRPALSRIVHVASIGSPMRRPEAAYFLADNSEHGQGVLIENISGEEIGDWTPSATGGWDEFAYPGDRVARGGGQNLYVLYLWAHALDWSNPDRPVVEVFRRAAALCEDEKAANQIVPLNDPGQLAEAKELFLSQLQDPAPDELYGTIPYFDGMTATMRAADRLARRLWGEVQL